MACHVQNDAMAEMYRTFDAPDMAGHVATIHGEFITRHLG